MRYLGFNDDDYDVNHRATTHDHRLIEEDRGYVRRVDGCEDPVLFDMPVIQPGPGMVFCAVVVQSVEDVRKWVNRKVQGRDKTLAAAIGLCWLRGEIESRISFVDFCHWVDCDIDRIRKMILDQFPAGRLDALSQTKEYFQVLSGTCKKCDAK